MGDDDDLVQRDLDVLWHPATHFADHERLPPLPVVEARGSWLRLADGRSILDAISSWWTCLHGHGDETIVEAIADQVRRLDHVMLAGFTHRPAVALAEQLRAAAPAGYGRVFYADCGSAAIEVALKLSYQARLQRGEPRRRRFAALHNAYHGETLGALAVCGHDGYRATFEPLLPDVVHLPAPDLRTHASSDLGGDAGAESPEADRAIELLRNHADELTAVVVEPLVQCAGRMTMTGSGYYRRLVEAAQALGIHVIADEIAVAFGRTGKLFASEWSGVSPDLLCLSKGLSGGVLPLACVLLRRGFEDDFKGDPSRSFLHSHTFTGNPIACASGLASLALLQQRRLPGLGERVQRLEAARHAVAQRCGDRIVAHRQAGTIVAFDVDAQRGPSDGRLSLAMRAAALARGVLLRPLGHTVYWMPPLTIADDEIDHLASTTVATLEAVLR